MSSYTDFFASLNPNQKTAVTTIEGPVLVVAGPGTGKTQVLVGRIAQILKETDTRPESILALTFTESAAKNMRSRLVSLIGSVGYAVRIATFHAFCSEVLTTHPEYFPLARQSEALTDLERFDFLQQSLRDLPLKRLRPVGDPFLYVRDCIGAISDLKREGVGVAQFQELAASKLVEAQAIQHQWQTLTHQGTRRVKGAPARKMVFDQLKAAEKWVELGLVYQDFQQKLAQAARFDFDDMISLVVAAFREHQELLVEYQENLQYFLVDEYQDTNSAQDTLLDLLAAYWGDQANVFVVGDPNQAIFRFQGASVENMLRFVERYKTAQVITLNQGYRCPQSFYDAATALISHNQVWLHSQQIPYSTQLFSVNHATTPVSVLSAPTQQLEAVYVAKQIEKLLQSGVHPDKIAVLYRTNHEREVVIEALRKWQVPYVIEGGIDILMSQRIQQLLVLCRAVVAVRAAQHDSELFACLLIPWLGLDSLTVMQLSRLANQQKLGLSQLLQLPLETVVTQAGDWQIDSTALAKIWQFYAQLNVWSGLDVTLTLPAWFELVLAESGYLESIHQQSDVAHQVLAITTLFAQIKQLVAANHTLKVADFLQAITTFQTHQLALMANQPSGLNQAVTLSTVHKAKGREWDYVFVTGVSDGKWGNTKDRAKLRLPAEILTHARPGEKDRNEDDRRLFYVAITRARKHVCLSWPQALQKVGRAEEKIISQFVAELGETAVVTEITTDLDASATDLLLQLVSPVVKSETADQIRTRQQEFFGRLVSAYVWSITGLNAYLRDPKEFVLQHLLRVPRAKPEPMTFGTAVHTALEYQVRQWLQTGQVPVTAETIHIFETALRQEVLTADALERRLAHGREILQKYLATQKLLPNQILLVERAFGKGSRGLEYQGVPISGRIDRVDILDAAKKQVVVVDYKTGQPKSDKQICGLTKDDELSAREVALPEAIRGAYKRQLLFYKLLANRDQTFSYQVTHGRFEFVEPDRQSGKLITRTFALPDEEVMLLGELLIQVATEVRALDFLQVLDL